MGDHHIRASPFETMRSASRLIDAYSCIVSSGEYFSSITDHSFSLSIQSGMTSGLVTSPADLSVVCRQIYGGIALAVAVTALLNTLALANVSAPSIREFVKC
jgi:hypothetical protein